MAAGTLLVGRKKGLDVEQVNTRFPADIVKRIDRVAAMLGLDRSNFVRMMIVEKLPEYERRARDVRGDMADQD